MSRDSGPPPLRTTAIDLEAFVALYEQTPGCWHMQLDWADRRTTPSRLRRVLRRRGCTAVLPISRGADHIDLWLRQVNAFVGRPDAFSSGRAYELIDLLPGSDIYAIVLCPIGALPSVAGEG